MERDEGGEREEWWERVMGVNEGEGEGQSKSEGDGEKPHPHPIYSMLFLRMSL